MLIISGLIIVFIRNTFSEIAILAKYWVYIEDICDETPVLKISALQWKYCRRNCEIFAPILR